MKTRTVLALCPRHFLSVFLLCGCASQRLPHVRESEAADYTTLWSKRYFGVFGDGTKAWVGANYRDSLSSVTHLPTKSEILVSIRSLSFEAAGMPDINVTNMLTAYAQGMREMQTAASFTNIFETRGTKVSSEETKNIPLELPHVYLRSEYDGRRVSSERYNTNEVVANVLYVTKVGESERTRNRTFFVVLAMVPKDVSVEERQQVLANAETFLKKVVLYPPRR